MIDEGYVKFRARWEKGSEPSDVNELVEVRNQLYRLGWIGEYPDVKIGFGNVSQRVAGGSTFVVSGTATGHIAEAEAGHFCTVTSFDIAQNYVECVGPVTASSESLTHAMLYACDTHTQAILHIHHLEFWEYLLQNAPSSHPDVPYGTPEMALEMKRLFAETDLAQRKILAMAGHREGIIAIGANPRQAMEKLEKEWKKLKSQ